MKEKQTLEEFINSQPYYGHCTTEYLEGIEVGAKWQEEQSKEMEENQYIINEMKLLIELEKAIQQRDYYYELWSKANQTFKQQEQ
jgi:hypothetical protein